MTATRVRTLTGFVATFENADGDTITRYRIGPAPQALRDLCDHLLTIDPTYRLVCYSTPDTITTDLAVSKQPQGAKKRQLPERSVLGQIGRLEMLHPRLRREEPDAGS